MDKVKNMNDKWNEFVYDLCEARNRNVEESEYQFIIESQLKLLGWLKFKGEICHKANIPIGNNNFIQPDILIRKDDTDLFVIEVKRPVHMMTERERQQLVSYMRQLKLIVGVYIGERIEVFYDKPGSQDIETVLIAELRPDEPSGEMFVEQFDRIHYNEKSVIEFCEEQLKKIERKKELLKVREQILSDGDSVIVESLKQYLVKIYDNSFTEEKIEEMLSTLKFSVESQIDEMQHSHHVITTTTYDSSLTIKNGRDFSKYTLNGSSPMGKYEFVVAVVKEYLKQNSDKTYSELESVFKPQFHLRGNRIDYTKGSNGPGVIRPLSFIRQKGYDDRLYYDEVLYSADKIPFKICILWGEYNIGNIIELAKRLGFDVKVNVIKH